MKHKVFTIYDSKAEHHFPPQFLQAPGQAIRYFEDEANNPESPIGKHPQDYSLFQIGEFDDDLGLLTPLVPIKSLGVAHEFIKE